MPLFELKPKTSPVSPAKNEDGKLSTSSEKTLITANKPHYTGDFAYCSAVVDKFYYVANINGLGVVDRFQLTKNDSETLSLFSIKIAMDLLKMCNRKNITIYSKYGLEDIQAFARIENIGSIDRYKAREILAMLENFTDVKFKTTCPYPDILETAKKVEELKNA